LDFAQKSNFATEPFFTPVVDDPYDYGAIAAANAMSDVYAMGGEVLLALNIGAFPADMPPAIITDILRGGAEKVREAGAIIAGGHTVTDAEPKYGLAVSGLIHPERILTKGGARPGDLLVLTKPLGTGVISTALKRELAAPTHVASMVASMKHLNRAAAQAAQATGGIKAATDITGFGLLGHGMEMANASGCQLVVAMHQLPLLEGVMDYATQGIFPGGATNNRRFFEPMATYAAALSDAQRMLLWDPQTSGGLLLAMPCDRMQVFAQACHDRAQACWVIGEVRAGAGIEVLP
jgi:selenide,water dikinase